MAFSKSLGIFVIASIILGVFNSVVQTLIPTILSEEARADEQGSIMGLNASYQSIGMIFGPVLGGAVATIAITSTFIVSSSLPFIVGSVLVLVCFLLSFKILRPNPNFKEKE